MSMPGACARTLEYNEEGGIPAVLRYLARQPILDRKGTVRGYELLYRNGPESFFRGESQHATRTMIDNTVLFGLQALTNSLPAFVNCTAEILTGEDILVLPAQSTVLEILESVEPAAEVIDACQRLRAQGYRLALDDFLYRPELDPLIARADFIKIDYLNTTAEQRRTIFAQLAGFHGVLLAEKIENRSEFEEACRDGCTLFQGYFFCQPSFLARRKVPANRSVHLRLLQMLDEDPLNVLQISETIKSEPSLAYRLLRYANSALFGLRHPATSIQDAILRVGDDVMRRIGTLAVTSELNSGSSPEILRMALVRGRFCETAAPLCQLDPTGQYLLGLFSMLPAMLQRPMEEALSGLPMHAPVREALMGIQNPFRCSLRWLELHERGDFEAAESHARSRGLDALPLTERYMQATLWADHLLRE